MSIISAVIKALLDFLFSVLRIEQKESQESKAEALEGRISSVENSYKEQEAASEKADEAAGKVKDQGNDDDVFGSEEWNSK